MPQCVSVARLRMPRLSLRISLPNLAFGLIALLVVVADQLTKSWIRTNLTVGQSIFENPLFQITYVKNDGAAFGLFQGHPLPMTIASIATIGIVLFYVIFIPQRFPPLNNTRGKAILGLVLGGIIGNLIDRLRFGYVTDFINPRWWPTFNIADSALTVGGVLLACLLIFLAIRPERHEAD